MLRAFLLAVLPLQAPALPAELAGEWRATLASPGGELPFALVLDADGAARVRNGPETIEVEDVRQEGGELVLGFPHYDARIRARLEGGVLTGAWEKRSSAKEPVRLVFRATRGAAPRFARETARVEGAPASIAGRWSVRFASNEAPAVGVFEEAQGEVTGTFLTTTGDFRYLAGSYDDGRLRLSCFDGAHAFLFDARANGAGLAGRFWSGDAWTEEWTAQRDDAAKLPDPWSLARWDDALPLPLLVFPDLAGELRSLGEWQSTSKGMLLVLFGSWCPNCHDELRDLAELDRRMRPKGLSIVGLAFEQSGEFERDAQQVRRALVRNRVSFPVLLAGRAAKGKASEALPPLHPLHAFPTTVFLHRDGRARAVHVGYSGPATGAAHAETVAEFERLAQELVDEPDADLRPLWPRIASGSWIDLPFYFRTTIFHDEKGARFLSDDPNWQPDPDVPATLHPLRVGGPSIWFEERLYAWDPATSVFLDPFDAGHRLVGEQPSESSTPETVWTMAPELVDGSSRSPDPRLRREALFTSVRAFRKQARAAPLDPAPFLDDPDPYVRAVAAWVAGELRVEAALPKLVANADHGFGPLRREVARALQRLARPETRATLEALARDIDPLVRQHAQSALKELGR